MAVFNRTKNNPLPLKTPPGTADFTMHTDTKDGLPILVCTMGKTILHYDARCLQDLYAMLKTPVIGWTYPRMQNKSHSGQRGSA